MGDGTWWSAPSGEDADSGPPSTTKIEESRDCEQDEQGIHKQKHSPAVDDDGDGERDYAPPASESNGVTPRTGTMRGP